MNTIKMPGFTAECARYSNHGRYLTRMCFAPNPQVIPQMINAACWTRSFGRTFHRCIDIGWGTDACLGTAIDLADSVCDF